MAPFVICFFSVDTHFGTAAGGDAEIPTLEDISDEGGEKVEDGKEMTLTQTKLKVPQK